ncbi:MAG: hypothetical protein QOJ23_4991 [Actinomycetota bacterium]|jgi:hypothetical protein|nr:hypothetical protein [Actinomycetota bacterium]
MLRMRSALVVAVVAAAAVVAQAAAASAHEEISPKTFPTGQPTFFTLTAANEETVNLVKIVLHAPTGVAFGTTTRSPAAWSVTRTDDTITWTGGAVKPNTFETWGYEIEGADQPGTLAYKVTLGFADAKTDDVEVDVNAVAPGSAGAPSATTVTTGAAAPAAAAPADSEDRGGDSDSGASGQAKAALAVAIVALLVAAGALAVGGRRRRDPGRAGGGGGAGATQDW